MTDPAISIQLWTVRDELTADLDGTLAKLSAIGFTNVEAFGFVSRADELAAAFARHGISSPTGHASLASGTENPFDSSIAVPTPDEVFAAAKKLGMTTVFDPFVAPDRWESVEEIAKTAEALNAAAAIGAGYGISRRLSQPQPGVPDQDRRALPARDLRRAARPGRLARARPLLGLGRWRRRRRAPRAPRRQGRPRCTSRTARSSPSRRSVRSPPTRCPRARASWHSRPRWTQRRTPSTRSSSSTRTPATSGRASRPATSSSPRGASPDGRVRTQSAPARSASASSASASSATPTSRTSTASPTSRC